MYPYFVFASSKCSGETEYMHRLSEPSLLLSCQPRVTVTQYFVYNCYVKHDLYTPHELTRIDRSLAY